MTKILLATACLFALGATIGTANAQNCRAEKSVAACMACVQKKGHAGSSGGRNFCLGLTNERGRRKGNR